MQARPLAPCVHIRMLTHTHTLVLVHHGPRMRAPLRPPPAHQILCPPRPGKDPVELGTGGTRGHPMDTQWTWGPGLARRPDVRSRFRRSGEHPMDLGYLVDRRPDLRWRGTGPIKIARLPWRRGGAICDSVALIRWWPF